MFGYDGNEDSFGPTLVGEVVNGLVQVGIGTWWKKKPGSYLPGMTEAGLAVVGTGLKNHFRHPYCKAISEASGSGGVAGMGLWAAANMTLFGTAKGPIPMNRSAHTASGARGGGFTPRNADYAQPGYTPPAPGAGYYPIAGFGAG